MKRNCDTCIHHLGAGDCALNKESECREGGGYELYEADTATPQQQLGVTRLDEMV